MSSVLDLLLFYKDFELYRLSFTKNILKYKITRFHLINHIRCFGYLKFVSLVDLKIEENIPLVEVTLELPYFSLL